MSHLLSKTRIDDLSDSPFSGFTQMDWVKFWIVKYGGYDGVNHKTWVIDQVLRITTGTSVEVFVIEWSDGQSQIDVKLGEPSAEYRDIIQKMHDRDEFWEEGTAP